jgi:integrase
MEESADKTVNNVLGILSNMVRVAKNLKVIREMPLEKFGLFKVDNSKPPPFYAEEELGRLVKAALKLGKHIAAAVLLGADAGLRCGEILALPPYGVKWQLRTIHIDRQVWRTIVDSPKGGRARDVPMTDRLEWTLKSLGQVKGDRLLQRKDGLPYNVKQMRALVAQAQFEAGLEATGNLHILRHTFCTRLAMKGVPPVTIQKLAGHAHLSTTMRYMHVVKGAEAAAIAELNARLPDEGLSHGEYEGAAGSFGRILVVSTEATKTSVLSPIYWSGKRDLNCIKGER